MSETDIMPRPHSLVKEANGLKRWSPVFDSITVESLSGGGRLLLVFVEGKSGSFYLSADQAEFISSLLRPSSNE
jgi:hypothetical protein